MKELKTKALKAAERYVERRGYSVLDTGYKLPGGDQIDIVANEGNALVFIDVLTEGDADRGFPTEDGSEHAREAKEMAAVRWLQGQDGKYTDMAVRFDVVSVLVIAKDRALIRHHINAMGESALVPDLPVEFAHSIDKEPMLACATA